MKALVWNGKHDVSVNEVREPKIEHPRDAIVKITSTAICGSDLHLYDGLVQTMESGDILGTVMIGLLSGIVAALRQNTWIDQAAMVLAMLGISLPSSLISSKPVERQRPKSSIQSFQGVNPSILEVVWFGDCRGSEA